MKNTSISTDKLPIGDKNSIYPTKVRGSYASVLLDNLVHNYREASRWVGEKVEVSCVVKADAYGHGEGLATASLVEAGLKTICVSTVTEGVRLRKLFPQLTILIMGFTPSHLVHHVRANKLIQAISTFEEAQRLNEDGPNQVHLKINTGMNRLGFHWEDVNHIRKVFELQNLTVEGIFSHMHSSDSEDKASAQLQRDRYFWLTEQLEQLKLPLGIKHLSNSAGIIDLRSTHLQMVREGIMLYGIYPSDEVDRSHIKLKECMELRSYIATINHVKEGDGISYGHTFIAPKDMRVATINLGYSDGVFRHLSNKGEVIIRDRRVPIVGRVCMNMFMVDVSDIPDVAVEDEVILFGQSETTAISIEEVAKWAGTIGYEVVCRTGASMHRVYIKDGKIVDIENGLLYE